MKTAQEIKDEIWPQHKGSTAWLDTMRVETIQAIIPWLNKHSTPSVETWSCDSATGTLYENGEPVGKLITGNSGAWLRLIEQANAKSPNDAS